MTDRTTHTDTTTTDETLDPEVAALADALHAWLARGELPPEA